MKITEYTIGLFKKRHHIHVHVNKQSFHFIGDGTVYTLKSHVTIKGQDIKQNSDLLFDKDSLYKVISDLEHSLYKLIVRKSDCTYFYNFTDRKTLFLKLESLVHDSSVKSYTVYDSFYKQCFQPKSYKFFKKLVWLSSESFLKSWSD